jgi:hypothetical protein
MARYPALFGKRVEAHYRAGDIYLSSHGILVAETERSVFLEERFTHNGKEKTIRVEIPHDYLIRLSESQPQPDNSSTLAPSLNKQS